MTTANSPSDSSRQTLPFELRGSLFTLTVMELHSGDLDAIAEHLETKFTQAPGFFQNAPVIIDLDNINSDNDGVDFNALYELIRKRGMIPVAVRNGSDRQKIAATAARLPALPPRSITPAQRSPADEETPESQASSVETVDLSIENVNIDDENTADSPAPPTPAPPAGPQYRIYNQPVRSGQKVHARGDLILLKPVSAGAEVVADGNIHAYGPFRGRALAGANGDRRARIFCHQLEAELVAIAGNYRVVEQSDSEIWQQSVQVYLDQDEHLIISKLSR